MQRTTLLTALYGTDSRTELLTQFDSKLSTIKGSESKRYTHLLEQVLFYSHAIIYGQAVQTVHNYRMDFMRVAKNNKALKLNSDKVEQAFSFFNRTVAKELTKTTIDKPKQATQTVEKACIAKVEIARLKEELDTKSYKLARGQKVEDKEVFIMIAIIAMATGARLQDIMAELTITTRKGVAHFNGVKSTLLTIDTKTAQSYLRAIRKHYKDRYNRGIDISTGIRKAVKRLNIAISPTIIEDIIEKNKKAKKQKRTDLEFSENLNHLNQLYKDCI